MARGQMHCHLLTLLVLTLTALLTRTHAHPNFTTCKAQFFNGTFQSLNVTPLDTSGQPVSYANLSSARGMSYHDCVRVCGGTGDEAFSWSVFSQQFNAWLVPWLALFSQLPFTAPGRWDNIASALLTMGSPALAIYSLTLTTLNTHWLATKFGKLKKIPNARQAAEVLSALQHVPVNLRMEEGLLASLVVLRENDDWWREMSEQAVQTRHWNVPAAVNILWVVLSFVFTLIDSFQDFGDFISSHGHAVAAVWMWLVPIVIGWLQVGCQSDANQLRRALSSANERAYVAGSVREGEEPGLVRKGRSRAIEQAGVPLVKNGLRRRVRRKVPSGAIGIVGSTLANLSVPPTDSPNSTYTEKKSIQHHGTHRDSQIDPATQTTPESESYDWTHQADAHRTAPVFNYARSWLWAQEAEHVWMMFWAADVRARRGVVVRGASARAARMRSDRELSRGMTRSGVEGGEIVEELEGHQVEPELEWEEHETLQTRNYTGTQEDVVAYCNPFDLGIPVGSSDPMAHAGTGTARTDGIPARGGDISGSSLSNGSIEKVGMSETRLEEAFSSSNPFSHYPTSFHAPIPAPQTHLHTPTLASHVLLHTFIAAALGLFLQWTTAGSAILIAALTPTTGIGCRSAAYLAYTVFGTLSFGCVLVSSGLAHVGRPGGIEGEAAEHDGESLSASASSRSRRVRATLRRGLGSLSTPLRRLGKLLAFTNALWILSASLFQFSSIYNTCWCESSALSRGANKAYILFLTGDDLIGLGTRKVWIGGVIGSAGACIVYLALVQVWMAKAGKALGR